MNLSREQGIRRVTDRCIKKLRSEKGEIAVRVREVEGMEEESKMRESVDKKCGMERGTNQQKASKLQSPTGDCNC